MRQNAVTFVIKILSSEITKNSIHYLILAKLPIFALKII